MSSIKAKEFIKRHGMAPELSDPVVLAERMVKDMEKGLAGEKSSLPMIPTYISGEGEIPTGEKVVVIDAGGTNFRCGLASFTGTEWCVEKVSRQRMPGIEKPATWEEFIAFVADNIQPLLTEADKISFCFSYNADITPEIDGLVKRIDKEVVITGSSGKLVGASLEAELERRGISGKRVYILNDTVAALLGAASLIDKSGYSGFAGQISGTGANTCCTLPYKRITKLNRDEDKSILINLESGLFDGVPQGDFDVILDRESNNPGEKIMEKLIAGAYLGELGRLSLCAAADEGLLSEGSCSKVRALGKIDASYIDAWSCGEKLEMAADNEEDGEFVKEISLALFERAARCTCANITAIMLLTGAGTEKDKPMCVCAEGSLVDKSTHFRPMFLKFLDEYAAGKLHRYAEIKVGRDTTLPGSAAAALLNK